MIFGELERIKSCQFRSDASLTRHNSSQQCQKTSGDFVEGSSAFQQVSPSETFTALKSQVRSWGPQQRRTRQLWLGTVAPPGSFSETRHREERFGGGGHNDSAPSSYAPGEVLAIGFVSLAGTKALASRSGGRGEEL